MAIKIYKPKTPGQRFKSGLAFGDVTKTKPEKSQIAPLTKTGGRSRGRVTARSKGGGHKRNFRLIDFVRSKKDIMARIAAIEYDHNRSANIALLHYTDGEKKYILAPQELKIGDQVFAGEKAEIKPGNALPLGKMPIGTVVHNIELIPGAGGQIVRSAGAGAIVAAKEGKWVHLKLPSKEIRKVHSLSYATVGQVGILIGKILLLAKREDCVTWASDQRLEV